MTGKVLNVQKTENIIRGQIMSSDGKEYTFFNPRVFVRPDYDVEFELVASENGETHAVIIQLIDRTFLPLAEDMKQMILQKVSGEVKCKRYMTSHEFSDYLKEIGITNVKEYARNMTCFISEYLSPDFVAKTNVKLNKKVAPFLIVSCIDENTVQFKADASSRNNQTAMQYESSIVSLKCDLIWEIEKKGFADFSMLKSLFEQYHINAAKVAPTFSDFLAESLSEFEVQDGVVIDSFYFHRILVKKGTAPYPRIEEYEGELLIQPELLKKICSQIEERIRAEGFISAEHLPQVFQECGLPNYHIYSESLTAFSEKYLTEYIIKKHAYIGGKDHPSVLVHRAQTCHFFNIDDAAALDAYFEAGEYYEFLSSRHFARHRPADMPFSYLEKALTCAKRMLTKDTAAELCLNSFQKELLNIPLGSDFIKTYKCDGVFDPVIIQECFDTAIPKRNIANIKEIEREAKGLLNALGRLAGTTHNTEYNGLISRTESCMNELYPFFVLIKIIVSPGKKYELLNEMCMRVKSAGKTKGMMDNSLSDPENWLYLLSILSILQEHGELENPPKVFQTQLFSIFVDLNAISEISAVSHFFTAKELGILFALSNHYEEFSETEYKKMFSEKISRELFQKISAQIWEKTGDVDMLPIPFLRLLAFTLKYDSMESVDEIVRLRISEGRLTKKEKRIMLLYSYPIIIEQIYSEPAFYGLGTYAKRCFEDFTDLSKTAMIKEYWMGWDDVADEYFEKSIASLLPVTNETANAVQGIFEQFKFNFKHEKELQNSYADWLLNECSFEDFEPSDLETGLHELYNDHAYEAFRRIYAAVDPHNPVVQNESLAVKYVDVLISLHLYEEALQYVINCNQDEQIMLQAIIDICDHCGISEQTLSIFNKHWSIEEAITFVFRNYRANAINVINTLVILYSLANLPFHAFYLYACYENTVIRGHSHIYTQFLRWCQKRQFTKIYNRNTKDNRYTVIEKAFAYLSTEQLIEFLDWCGSVKLPTKVGLTKKQVHLHPFASIYDGIIKDARNVETWRRFYSFIYRRPNINAWKLCVCANVISFLEGSTNPEYTKTVIEMAESQLDLIPDEIQHNYLNMVCPFVAIAENGTFFQKLHPIIMQNKEFRKRVCNNPITQKENTAVSDLVQICISRFSKTRTKLYFDIVEQIRENEDILKFVDVSTLFDYDGGRFIILRHMCKMYGMSENPSALSQLLFHERWNGLDYLESNFLTIVRFLYSDQDENIEEILPSRLNSSEHSIIRIKRDVAHILSVYPSKEELFSFEKETFSIPYKLLVYSIVAAVLYDQDLYASHFKHGYEALKELRALDIFFYYSYKLYLYQIYHNSDYDFFYIERRYQKALISQIMMNPGTEIIDDSAIVSSMEFFGHKEISYQTKYVPFRTALLAFIKNEAAEDPALSQEINQLFLSSMLTGNFTEFFDTCIKHNVQIMDPDCLKNMKLMIMEIAFREYGVNSFKYYVENGGGKQFLLELSKQISKPVYDVLYYIDTHLVGTTVELFSELAHIEKPNACVKRILELPENEFDAYSDMFIPFLASAQLPLRLYEKLYSLVAKGDTNERYLAVLPYIAQDYPQAQSVYYFLRCIQAAMKKNEEKLKAFFNKADFEKNLPEKWRGSLYDLEVYMRSDMSAHFTPKRLEGDSSFRSAENVRIRFVDKLVGLFHIKTDENADIEELRAAYSAAKRDKRSALGIQLLQSIPQTSNKHKMYNEMVHKVGMNILADEQQLSAEVRMLIISDLYATSNSLNAVDLHNFMQQSRKWTEKLLEEGLSVRYWCLNYEVISKILVSDVNTEADDELAEINQKVIRELCRVMEPEYPLDQRLDTLKAIQPAAKYYSKYAGYLQKSIELEIRKLEKGIRLRVELVNDVSTDGCIYGQIINKGQSTVRLNMGVGNQVRVTMSINDNPNEMPVKIENIPELRHGYVSGFQRKLPLNGETPDTIDVTISAWINQVLYSRCKKTISIVHDQETIQLEPQGEWYNVKSAVTDEDMLFGRDVDKKNIRNSMNEGITVLYGPSRIGKTSLLNWTRRFLSKEIVESPHNEIRRIITVLLGGEGSAKERDYHFKFYNREERLNYSDASQISEYLLSDSIINSFDRVKRLSVIGEPLPSGCREQIISILENRSMPLEERYSDLEDLLRENKTEIWLLMDEFQQVVEKWNMIDRNTSPFAMVCAELKVSNDEYPHAIRLVLCGSDDLLKQMTSADNSVWRKIIPSTGILVGPLPRAGFQQMICEAEKFPKHCLCYSPAAIEALYTYTGGIALYGKEICNTVLRRICRDANYFTNRQLIFPSDISWAVQTLLNRQQHEQKTNESAAEGIVHIYDAVVKNLDEKTDKLYLIYMAQWLCENYSHESFPKSLFTSKKLKSDYDNIEESLTIAVKRGIIQEQTDESGIVASYTFTTLFYYYAFLGINRLNCAAIEHKLFDQNDEITRTKSGISEKNTQIFGLSLVEQDEFKNYFKNMDPSDQAFWLIGLLGVSKPPAVERLKDIIADQYHVDKSVFNQRSSSETIAIADTIDASQHFNIAVVSEAIHSLHDAASWWKQEKNNRPPKAEVIEICRKAVQDLPLIERLEYVDRIDELTDEQQLAIEPPADYDDAYVEDVADGVIQSGIDLIDWAENGDGAEFLSMHGIDDIEELRRHGEKHFNTLLIGLYLRWLFQKISAFSPGLITDYSPSSIMLCKTIERMLKEKHLPLYKDRSVWVNRVMTNDPPHSPVQFPRKATIGTFTTAMATMFEIDSADREATKKQQNRDAFLAHTSASEAAWFEYYTKMKNVLAVRNRTAHTNQVTDGECDDVIKTLFEEELLNQTVDYL